MDKLSPKRTIYDYRMSMHYGVAATVDAILGIWIKDKRAWPVVPDADGAMQACELDIIGEVSTYEYQPLERGTPIFREFMNTKPYLYGANVRSTERTITNNALVELKRNDLFGGDDAEGGVSGTIDILLGYPSQTLPARFIQALGVAGNRVPRFFGLTSLVFMDYKEPGAGNLMKAIGTGGGELDGDDGRYNLWRGFRWGSNTPYLPPVGLTVFRRPSAFELIDAGADPQKQILVIDEGRDSPDANPAAILLEVLLADWGMDLLQSEIDIQSFITCAERLAEEDLGLSLILTREMKIKDFVQEILDHIRGAMFLHPQSGLWTLRLIRSAGTAGTGVTHEFVVSEENSRILSRQRTTYSSTINKLTVSYTDPRTEQEQTVTVVDQGNIQIQGREVADSRDYHGIRKASVALSVAERDLREASRPFMELEVAMGRTAWQVAPADRLLVTIPEEGLEEVAFLVRNVQLGETGARELRISLVEDITPDLEDAGPVQEHLWQNPDLVASPALRPYVTEAPGQFLALHGASRADLEENDPRGVPILLSDGAGTRMNFLSTSVSKDGGDTYRGGARLDMSPSGVFVDPSRSLEPAALYSLIRIVNQPVSDFPVNAPEPYYGAIDIYDTRSFSEYRVGDYILIVGTTAGQPPVEEWCYIEQLGAKQSIRIRRGVMDTIPRRFSLDEFDGITVYHYRTDADIQILGDYVDGQNLKFRAQPTDFGGAAEAVILDYRLGYRAHLPATPRNVRLEGLHFADLTYAAADYPAAPRVSWSNRNRFLDNPEPKAWNTGNVTPELNQRTVIRVHGDNAGAPGTQLQEHVVAGTSFNLDGTTLPDIAHVAVSAAFVNETGAVLDESYATSWMTITRTPDAPA